MITLDTSGVFALLNRRDPDHHAVVGAFTAARPPRFVPAGILGEAAYLIEARLGTDVLAAFLEDLAAGSFALHCGEGDLDRIRQLVLRYRDLPLGFADAAAIACAERHGGRVLTLDLRHFGVVAREGRLVLLPQ